jgi:hypothetical protein
MQHQGQWQAASASVHSRFSQLLCFVLKGIGLQSNQEYAGIQQIQGMNRASCACSAAFD